MKVTQRIPTEQYAYIEFEDEYDTIDKALAMHKEIQLRYAKFDFYLGGMNKNEWARFRRDFIIKGTYDVNVETTMNWQQKMVAKQIMHALSDAKAEDPVI